MFFTLIDWDLIRNGYEHLFGSHPTTLYGLPKPLIEALAKESTTLMTKAEIDFELQLAEVLQQHHAVGIVNGRTVQSGLLAERTPITVSSEDFTALGWDKFGLTLEMTNQHTAEIESRAAPFHDQLVAYAGWLITNRQFLDEVSSLRKRTTALEPANSDGSILIDREMNEFLGRWHLCGMTTWDLPEPQGPSLSGTEMPAAADRGAATVSVNLPLSVRLPSTFPIRDLVGEIRRNTVDEHLAEWQLILDHTPKSMPGVKQFCDILKIQFFRNVVLENRYGTRTPGIVRELDSAFGTFLGVGEDSVKKRRLHIASRLKTA